MIVLDGGITGEPINSNWDKICLIKILKCIGLGVHNGVLITVNMVSRNSSVGR